MNIAGDTDSPWVAVLCIAVLMLAALAMQLSAHDYNVSYFIAIGDRYIRQADEVPEGLYILPDSAGYDGQFYYQLALNPFSPQDVNAGLAISNGPYRHQRIVYPLLAWLFSFARPSLVPTTLVVVNYLALCVVAWLGARFSQLHGRHALWGVLFALYPGFLFTLTRDLTEIVGVMFLLAAVSVLYYRKSNMFYALLFTLAVAAREMALIAVVALGIALALPSTRERRIEPAVVLVPLVFFGIWQAALWSKWGRFPILAGGHNIGLPGAGLLDFIQSLELGNTLHRIWAVELGLVALVMVVAVAVALRAPGVPAWHKLMWLGYACLALSLTHHVWIEDIAFMRALSELYLFSLMLSVAGARWSSLALVGAGTAITWVLVFLNRLVW